MSADEQLLDANSLEAKREVMVRMERMKQICKVGIQLMFVHVCIIIPNVHDEAGQCVEPSSSCSVPISLIERLPLDTLAFLNRVKLDDEAC